ncbi:MAG: DNA-protecting protein DprA [Nitrospinaceae bacterium]|nr:DNA-protecting protein DprA [Nitrospinaceae bacterium]NIR55678.1 DNA-protecting protein DprA [Nitrospinaceae bacterium]NIS86122.1 DNA-protecting protein DprA [Nitrospinaceae bacterium]NIT82966.1 DNA-protecting protein DprA [Nitrospinaceae bacterium]NIU45169.1 DNA-protecting protein DprA [Nitrospinaceae bacterium]
MEQDSRKYWMGLNMVLGVGKTLFHRLVGALGSPQKVFSATRRELMAVEGIGEKTARQILDFDLEKNLEREYRLLERMNARVWTLEDEEYPELLKSIYDPPPVIFHKGRPLSDVKVPLAVVGTRQASSYGKMVAEKLCQALCEQGIGIVSGMARGIDTLAHQAALKAGAPTLAVFGCGLEYTYPPESASLRRRIEEQGAVISEFAMSAKPDRNNFPARNRVISGLSHGTLVIEAGEKSGALITAQFALEQGREVFAVPGNIFSSQSRGTHTLIQMGAKLVDRPGAIIEELAESVRNLLQKETSNRNFPQELDSREKHLMSLLSVQEQHIDRIIENSHLSAAEVSATLVKLELKGMIRQTDGKMFLTNPNNIH